MDQTRKEQIAEELRMCWNRVAADVLRGEDGEIDESMTMSRDEVFEISLDQIINDPLPIDEWVAVTDPEREEIKMMAFPTGGYCW